MAHDTDFSIFDYSVPDEWYRGVYRDRKQCCSAARPFSLIHKAKADECWLIIHGYRGYPGEFVRPATDLFEEGFDVYVPRLPGHGTCGKDFIRSHSKDWMGLAANAVNDLKRKYSKVHLLGHSMGTAMAAIIGCPDSEIGKIVYVSPSFENLQMPWKARIALRLLSPFTPKVNCHWHPSSKYHLHYENAPCGEMYLGGEYWTWFFTRQLPEYYRILKKGLKALRGNAHEHLVICPGRDRIISLPSLELYREAVGDSQNYTIVDNGTHSLFYDKDPVAEQQAVEAVISFARKPCNSKK